MEFVGGWYYFQRLSSSSVKMTQCEGRSLSSQNQDVLSNCMRLPLSLYFPNTVSFGVASRPNWDVCFLGPNCSLHLSPSFLPIFWSKWLLLQKKLIGGFSHLLSTFVQQSPNPLQCCLSTSLSPLHLRSAEKDQPLRCWRDFLWAYFPAPIKERKGMEKACFCRPEGT